MPPKTRATATGVRAAPKDLRKPTPKKKKPVAKQTPKKTSARQKSNKVPPTEELWGFIQQQALINQTVLDELQGLKDKSSVLSGDKGSKNRSEGNREEGDKGKSVGKLSDLEVLSNTDTSDSDSDIEARVTQDMGEASALLQPRFTKHKGKNKSLKKIEKQIELSRPFNYLDRDTQRHVSRENMHPEELPFFYHIEGSLPFAAEKCVNSEVKGIIEHIHQVVRDVQVHNWLAVRRWSNQVIVRTAVGDWQWNDADRLQRARHSQYLVQQQTADLENQYPCYMFNRASCRHEGTHYGADAIFIHTCPFCFALDGARENHPMRVYAKRRSSSAYFRNRDENKDFNPDARNRFNASNRSKAKKFGRDKDQDDNVSKN